MTFFCSITGKEHTYANKNVTNQVHSYSNVSDKNGSSLPVCKFSVYKKSLQFFRSRLEMNDPHLVEFEVTFAKNIKVSENPDAIKGKHRYWTYVSPYGNYRFYSWNIDFGILSFGLLYAKSIVIKNVFLIPKNPPCGAHLGTSNTTKNIAEAFKELVNITRESYHVYEKSYFCFLAKQPGSNKTILYQLARYSEFPFAYVNYNCCQIKYFYQNNSLSSSCFSHQASKWSQCTLLPYLLGVAVFLYFPILALKFGAFFNRKRSYC